MQLVSTSATAGYGSVAPDCAHTGRAELRLQNVWQQARRHVWLHLHLVSCP